MILLTGNAAKYQSLGPMLESLGISLASPTEPLMEFQSATIAECACLKALWAARTAGSPALVDDAGLLLAAHPGFPGPMTKHALQTIAVDGWRALVERDARAEMVCVLAWSDGVLSRCWEGRVAGHIEPSERGMTESPGPLASWFVSAQGGMSHRERALEALRVDRWSLPI